MTQQVPKHPPVSSFEITKDMYTKANEVLSEQGKIIESNTLVLGFGEDGLPIGTSIPISYKSQKVLLSASHVAASFENTLKVRTFYKCDELSRNYRPKNTEDFYVQKWDPNFTKKQLEEDILVSKPRDLALITPIKSLDEINSYKEFYQLPNKRPDFSKNSSLITMGCIEVIHNINTKTLEGVCTVFGVVASDYYEFSDRDYIVCTVDTNTYEIRELGKKAISSFRGLSGSGLWSVVNKQPQLLGIAISEDLTEYKTIGQGTIWFHGPKSIYAALESWEIASQH